MLTGRELGYEIEGHGVFSDVNVSISPGDKVGLIGPNGAGKTTLLRILAGELEPTNGAVLKEDVEVGILPQDLRDWLDQSVYDFMENVTGVRSAKEAYQAAEATYNDNPQDQKTLLLYCDAADKFNLFGGNEFEGTAIKSLKRAGLDDELLAKDIGYLSGGQRTRVALAAIMATRYDVILLDEPTNNLDMEGIVTLEKFIKGSKAAFLMVSHDRRFLRNATSRIIELLGGDFEVNNYGLGYDEYVDARLRAYESEVRRYQEHRVAVKSLEASVRDRKGRANSAERGGKRTDSDKLTANYRSGRAAGHLARQAQAMETRLESLKSTTPNKPQEPISLDFMFPEGETYGQQLITLENAVVRYEHDGQVEQFGPYSLRLGGSERLAIIGANGTGKTTLIKAILGQVPLVSGNSVVSHNARIGYIDQNQTLPSPQATPVENLMALAPGVSCNEAMHLLVKFNFSRDHIDAVQASQLSGGERAKVILASIAAQKANLLILDEPTNNLDIPTIEGLQEALSSYKGAIVLVSHDREFIESIGIARTINLAN